MFLFSREILALVLARKNAIAHWRTVIGPTQTAKARDEAPDRYLMFCVENTFDLSLSLLFLVTLAKSRLLHASLE